MKKITNYFSSPKTKKKLDEETKIVESNETSSASTSLCGDAQNWPTFWTTEQIKNFCQK
jgi:hypothetical protein